MKGQAHFLDAHTVEVDGPEGTTRLEGEQILVALGSSPAIPALDGLRDVPYLTSDLLTSREDLELTALPASLIVIGGGYVAVELGQMFSRFGSNGTVLARSERLLSAYEPEIGLTLGDILRAEGLDVQTTAAARCVRRDGDGVVVAAEAGGEQREFAAARLLVATGRTPNTRGIGLEDVGVRATRTPPSCPAAPSRCPTRRFSTLILKLERQISADGGYGGSTWESNPPMTPLDATQRF